MWLLRQKEPRSHRRTSSGLTRQSLHGIDCDCWEQFEQVLYGARLTTQALTMGDDKLDLAFMIYITHEVAYRVLLEVGRAERAFNAYVRCVAQ